MKIFNIVVQIFNIQFNFYYIKIGWILVFLNYNI